MQHQRSPFPCRGRSALTPESGAPGSSAAAHASSGPSPAPDGSLPLDTSVRERPNTASCSSALLPPPLLTLSLPQACVSIYPNSAARGSPQSTSHRRPCTLVANEFYRSCVTVWSANGIATKRACVRAARIPRSAPVRPPAGERSTAATRVAEEIRSSCERPETQRAGQRKTAATPRTARTWIRQNTSSHERARATAVAPVAVPPVWSAPALPFRLALRG